MFEVLLYQHLLADDNLKRELAIYDGKPAIFNQKAPPDLDAGWETQSQYGRVVFSVYRRNDSERKTSGRVEICAYCEDGKQTPEDLEEMIRNRVDSYFFSSENETIAAQWSTSEYFTAPEERVNGVYLVFDMIAFPCIDLGHPDPIRLLGQWAKEQYPAAKVIGYDALHEVWKPTTELPGIYARLSKTDKCSWIPSTFAGDWYTAYMYVHFFTAEMETGHKMAKEFMQSLNRKKVLRFEDHTYMRVDTDNRLTIGADVLRQGQLEVQGAYCVMNIQPKTPLKNIYIREKGE